jgi:hypothetical protein
MHCAPNKAGIWVRIQMECFCRLIDRASGKSDEFALGVVAKTGLTKDPKSPGALTPGYDYWLIFSKDTVYTRRTHASVYLRNPTTLNEAEFGKFGWKLVSSSGTKLSDVAAIKTALESGKRLIARSEFASANGARSYQVEYPVKWADCGVDKKQYRVETGPVVLLDPERAMQGKSPVPEDFQWAYVDFRQADSVRLLLDRPTPILSEAGFFPPKEDKRESRPNPPLTAEQVALLQKCVGADGAPIPPKGMRELFSTDHYSDAAERKSINTLYAID